MKLVIAGSRGFNDYKLLREMTDYLVKETLDNVEIVSGGARGADVLGEKYAKERGYPIKSFPANWELHGKGAGYIRNEEMAEYGNYVLLFWDGESKGTQHMADLADKHGCKVYLIKYKDMKELELLNSEGPIILARKMKGTDRISLKFDDNKDILFIGIDNFMEFIEGTLTLTSPNKNEKFNYLNFGRGFGKPTEEQIENFLKD